KRKIISPHQSEEFFKSPDAFDEIKSTKTAFFGRVLHVRGEATKKTNTWNSAPKGWRSFGRLSRCLLVAYLQICASQTS
ncbi:MAG: hypothetical protein WCS96_05300, partial [Victivallales bacterium]